MPTGYTADLYDGKDVTFEQFVLRCARGMGALITMRDASMDAPIPERFEPSDYHPTEAAKAQAKLAELRAMTPEQMTDAYFAERAEVIVQRTEAVKRKRELRERYNGMLRQVEEWDPPAVLASFKQFMLEQINESIRFDCSDGVYPSMPPEDPAEWWDAKIDRAERDVTYHAAEYVKEVERVNDRNEWLAALHGSLGSRV